MSRSLTVAQYLAQDLHSRGIEFVYELTGGMIVLLLDAIHTSAEIEIISVHHEQAAGFMAEGQSRVSGKPAVAFATSGPGATNLLTAIASCYFDSSPVVFITGQVNTDELSVNSGRRQGGFQETDIVAMATPVTKWAKRVEDSVAFPEILDEAFNIASSGRQGPVLLDIPMNIQKSLISLRASPAPEELFSPFVDEDSSEEKTDFVQNLMEALASSQRPLIIAGGGIRSSQGVKEFRDLVAKWNIPVVTSLMGHDSVSIDSPQRVGFFGSYGNRWANWAISESDLLLVLGSRLDIKQTGSDVAGFAEGRKIFHVDIDEHELNSRVAGCFTLEDDLKAFIHTLIYESYQMNVSSEWLQEINSKRLRWPDEAENIPSSGINPNLAIKNICLEWTDIHCYVSDVGQHQMWMAQSLRLTEDQRFITSGGLGAMGFGLPAAIGAAIGSKSPVCLIAGDGGFQLNIQELQTLVRLDLPLRIIVIDNGCHGMVRQFQQSYLDSRYPSSRWGYSAPEFCAIGNAYGIATIHIESERELQHALKEAMKEPEKAILLHIKIDADLNAYPKLAFGQAFGSMEPETKPLAMEPT